MTFFETHTASLEPVAKVCRHWLEGGWLDAPTASDLSEHLANDEAAFEASVPQVAADLSQPTGVNESVLQAMMRSGLANLRSMLASAEGDSALWMIQD